MTGCRGCVKIFALSILCGVALNIFVAWGAVLRAPFPFLGREKPGDYSAWPRSVPSDWPGKPDAMAVGHGAFIRSARSFHGVGALSEAAGASYAQIVTTAGWPLGSLEWEQRSWTHQGQFSSTERDLMSVRVPLWMQQKDDQRWERERLPLRPLPIGFIVDSGIWAFVVCGIAGATLGLRRRRRRRKGRCASCGYDRRGIPSASVCPECGEPGPSRE